MGTKFRKTFYVSLTVGFIFALMLWLIVVLNGEIVQAHQPGFVSQVHKLQQPGLNFAHRWFPCTAEVPEAPIGECESLKVTVVTILINGLLYAGILFIPIYIFRLFSTTLD